MRSGIEGRMRWIIFIALLVAVLAVLASAIRFGASPRIPKGAEVVWDTACPIPVTDGDWWA